MISASMARRCDLFRRRDDRDVEERLAARLPKRNATQAAVGVDGVLERPEGAVEAARQSVEAVGPQAARVEDRAPPLTTWRRDQPKGDWRRAGRRASRAAERAPRPSPFHAGGGRVVPAGADGVGGGATRGREASRTMLDRLREFTPQSIRKREGRALFAAAARRDQAFRAQIRHEVAVVSARVRC